MSGGRPRSIFFDMLGFTLVKKNNRGHAYCILCKKYLRNTAASRLRGHRNICKTQTLNNQLSQVDSISFVNCDNTPKKDVKTDMDTSENDYTTPSALNTTASTTADYLEPAQMYSYDTMDQWEQPIDPIQPSGSSSKPLVAKIMKQENEDFSTALASFVFGFNLPFNVVESPQFKKFVGILRPDCLDEVPSPKLLASKLLDKAYEDHLQQTREMMSTEAVVSLNGCGNAYVCCLLHSADGQHVFLDAWEEAEVGKLPEAIALAKQMYNTDVYAAVTRNAVSDDLIWHTTCNSHSANLLVKDVLGEQETENVVAVLKEFHQRELQQMLLDRGGYRLRLSNDGNYTDAYQSFVSNIEVMRNIASDGAVYNTNVRRLIYNDALLEDVIEIMDLVLNPLSILATKCREADCSIADAVHLWLDIRIPPKYKSQFENVLKTTLNKYALTAYYLHPFYDNSKLSKKQESVVNTFLLQQLDGAGLEDWDHFRNKTQMFHTLSKKQISKPLVFWNLAKMAHPQLSDLAVRLMKIPASAPRVDGVLSPWDVRGGLSCDRAKKRLHIYCSQRLKDKGVEHENEDEGY